MSVVRRKQGEWTSHTVLNVGRRFWQVIIMSHCHFAPVLRFVREVEILHGRRYVWGWKSTSSTCTTELLNHRELYGGLIDKRAPVISMTKGAPPR